MRRPFGQHFLFDRNILNKIIRCSQVTTDDTVVEIGPGLGTLTQLLAEHAGRVIAIEFDRKLIGRLKENLASASNVEVIRADALKFPYETIEGQFRVVANIPYHITTPIIFKLLQFRDRLSSMTLLLQREVAMRIVADPGTKDYGVLSITARLHTRPVVKFTVSRKSFSPPPRVDSAVVHFEVSAKSRYNIKNEDLFIDVVRSAFSKRRKTISNSLKSFKGIKEALERAGISPSSRPEQLSIDDFIRLANALYRLIID